MAVTADEYEIPLIVEERLIDLAEKMGTTSSKISNSIYNAKRGREKRKKNKEKSVRYVKVAIDDDIKL